MPTCGIERARLASPPESPRSSSTGGRRPLMAARASCSVSWASSRATQLNMTINGSMTGTRLSISSDPEYLKAARGRMDEIDYMGGNAAAFIDSTVNDLWTGS